jgi:mannose-6-phosphate isomerase
MDKGGLYPLQFKPILRRLIWGGRRLGTVLHKPIGAESDYAESWEISDYHDKVSLVDEGTLTGTSIRDLVHGSAAALMGKSLADCDQFPLLIKFIDAHQPLSVQVHPDDATARRLVNDSGKTEAWVILAADPRSKIYAGLKRGVGRDDLRAAIAAGNVEDLLHAFEPQPGDCVLIESGTVHAIGAGVLLAEIQQMSDATFRIYDWNRLGDDGKPRPLHIRESLESIDFDRGPVNPLEPERVKIAEGTRERLVCSKYFALERLTVNRPISVGNPDRFTILMGLKGRSEIEHEKTRITLDYGQTLLLPAANASCMLVPDGEAAVLTCVVP